MALRTFNWCSVCNYKFRKNKSPSDFHNRNCNNRQFYDFGLCHHCLEEHRISGICNQTMYCGGKLSSDLNETGKSGVSSSFPITGFLLEPFQDQKTDSMIFGCMVWGIQKFISKLEW